MNAFRVLRAAEEVAAEMSAASAAPSEDMLDYNATSVANNSTENSNCTCKTIQDYSKKKFQPNKA
jgi:hypothetical protein